MDETQRLILAELRDLREAFNENARKSGERLASLETSMKALVGNGSPGRLSIIENSVIGLDTKITHVEKKAQWVIGVWVGSSTVVVIAFAVLKFMQHF
jgi:hypothetical protein